MKLKNLGQTNTEQGSFVFVGHLSESAYILCGGNRLSLYQYDPTTEVMNPVLTHNKCNQYYITLTDYRSTGGKIKKSRVAKAIIQKKAKKLSKTIETKKIKKLVRDIKKLAKLI